MNIRALRETVGNGALGIPSLFLLLAIAALVWRRNAFLTFGVYIPTVKPSDVLILFALTAAFVVFLFVPSVRRNRERNRFLFRWARYLVFLGAFFLAGSVIAAAVFGNPFTKVDLAQYIRLGIGAVFFLLTLFLGWNRAQYVRLLGFSFLTSLALVPFLFLPEELILRWFLVVSPVSYTFLGFQPSTIGLGSYLVLPVILLFSLTVTTVSWRRYAYGVSSALLVAVTLWTGSRAAWLAALIGMLVVVFVEARWKHSRRRLVVGGGMIVLLFISGFLTLSPLARNTALIRVFPHIKLPTEVGADVIAQLPGTSVGNLTRGGWVEAVTRLPTSVFLETTKPIVDVGFREGRGEVWAKHARDVLRSPLGVGPGYASVFQETNHFGQSVNAHNVWLQVALSGGVGAFIAFVAMLVAAGGGLVRTVRRRRDTLTLWLAGAFVGMLVSATFIDALALRWFWVVLGLVVVAAENELGFGSVGS